MATQLREGDAVQVADREATAADEKTQIFFNHYRGLTGTLEKVYEDGRATVVVDEETLPKVIADRHRELTIEAKQKWLDGLSQEARSRLTPEEQQFKMRYTILVDLNDLRKAGARAGKSQAAVADSKDSRKADASAEKAAALAAKAVSAADLDKAEEEFLKARARQAKPGS